MTSPSTKDAQRLSAQYSLSDHVALLHDCSSRRDGSERSNTNQSNHKHDLVFRPIRPGPARSQHRSCGRHHHARNRNEPVHGTARAPFVGGGQL